MVLDLRQVFIDEKKSLPIECEFDMSELSFYGEFPLKKPVKANGMVSNRAGIVMLKVEYEAVYDTFCDRCGKKVSKAFKFPVQRVLVDQIFGDNEDDEMVLLQDFKLNFSEFTFTEIVLASPTKILCTENCKGCCSECGVNLNDGSCNCATKKINPQFAALADLIDN